MKRKLRMVLAGVLAVASLAMTAGAASYDNCADRLSDLGLFQGTGNGYQLDRAPTRAEAATMLVRLLGGRGRGGGAGVFRAVYRSGRLAEALCAVPV